MYQFILESFIGLRRKGNYLQFSPCFPDGWPSVKVKYRYLDTLYTIELLKANEGHETGVFINDNRQQKMEVELVNDNTEHEVKVVF
jgi:cellobiose phosphorylase